jgi:hypothetical protein
MKAVKDQLSEAPTTNEQWIGCFGIRSWCGPWNEEIAERVQKEGKEACQRYREGVEAMRAYFAKMA